MCGKYDSWTLAVILQKSVMTNIQVQKAFFDSQMVVLGVTHKRALQLLFPMIVVSFVRIPCASVQPASGQLGGFILPHNAVTLTGYTISLRCKKCVLLVILWCLKKAAKLLSNVFILEESALRQSKCRRERQMVCLM